MKKILLVEGNLREANQEFTDNGIKTHTESLKESIDYFTNDLEIDSVNPSSDQDIFDKARDHQLNKRHNHSARPVHVDDWNWNLPQSQQLAPHRFQWQVASLHPDDSGWHNKYHPCAAL